MSKEDQAEEPGASAFEEFMGGFLTHADPARRARSERLAAMKPGDLRRRKNRPDLRNIQFNVRVNELTKRLADEICSHKSWSQADLVEEAILLMSKSRKVAKNA